MDPPTVYVVDDDPAVRESLRWLIECAGYAVQTFDLAEEYLSRVSADSPGCLVLDFRMPGMSGLDLLDTLKARPYAHPAIMISGHGGISSAVRAMRCGAVDFLEKPFSDADLLDRIREALELSDRRREEQERHEQSRRRLAGLTPRERQVLNLVVVGHANKTIADLLGISRKTVEVHRARVMKKSGARSVAELVHLTQFAPVHGMAQSRAWPGTIAPPQ